MLKRTASILVVAFMLAASSNAADEPSATNVKADDLQTLIGKFLVKVKSIFHGNDPFNYGGTSSSSNSYGTVFNGSISGLIISGQSTMNVTHLKVVEADPEINFSLGLTFNGLMLTGNYGLYLDLLTLTKLYGNGELGALIASEYGAVLKLTDDNFLAWRGGDTGKVKAALFGINVTSCLTQDAAANNTLQFEDLSLDIEVPKLKVDVKNLLNRPGLSAYASQILNDILPPLLSDEEKLQGLLSSFVKSKLNPLMMQHEINLAVVRDFINHLIN